MNETYYEAETRLERSSKQHAKTARKSYKWTPAMTIALLWVLLAASAFALAYFYVGDIRNQLLHIQQTNAAATAELNQKLTELQTALTANAEQAEELARQFNVVEQELNAVQEQMSLAGDSLSTTAETKQALNDRISDLSKELEGLRKSINQLEAAARVY